ncbi:hypothetical protein K437DRAFT_258226 [Tilletiaria anomala UBC 951]|uniref:Pescadillo homolog n=1 Tax=Tilletiaria anomala (strain ATCC 24038 / CBS 436.72 / UBC 951) TaxID=1037660 RepID=A0A066VML2_TILAU|nr:uncharacterized protein K437DRAFT_258226 [Tilletiaria anomala UBC 951]KDN41518.1 hypothetical protein K437DRAFT_258226 [Tilletiaria anomala UBC 951]
MAKIKKKGTSGAAKNYITRTQAVKKLQLSLSDFRRLCILKGIFPRQPRHVKRANKGNNAPASFYYAKDIQFLQHEPVLQTLRQHKAFAKKLSKAIGKQEWSLAKSLQENHQPVVRLDHIIKQRYPTFTDSLRDVDDALCLLNLFAHLPVNNGDRGKSLVNHKVIANCATLCAQWQVYLMRTRSLRKIFLSIKGVYFQAEIRGQQITWLVPYLFTQHIPDDVDFRIMLTFLELYQTLIGFVMYKLYTDDNLVYPPHLDVEKDDAGAGVGAITLSEKSADVLAGRNETAAESSEAEMQEQKQTEAATAAVNGRKVSAKDVKKQIKAITRSGGAGVQEDNEMVDNAAATVDGTASGNAADSDKFQQASSSKVSTAEDASSAPLMTLAELESSSSSTSSSFNIFAPYYFFISRECPRALLEFVLRCFGASSERIGWDLVAGTGFALSEDDPRITHHFVDRPVPVGAEGKSMYDGSRHPGSKRVYVQPQWLIDSANARKLLPTEPYAPGKTLPPHLSPFVDEEAVRRKGGYVPEAAQVSGSKDASANDSAVENSSDEEGDNEEQSADVADVAQDAARPALAALLQDPKDGMLLESAELEAEAAGGEEEVERVRRLQAAACKSSKTSSAIKTAASTGDVEAQEEKEAKEMARMLMSNRQRKLYNKVSYSQGKKGEEKRRLEEKKAKIVKDEKKARKAGKGK